jgi:hypothetical protein
MLLMQTVQDDTMAVAGFEHRTFMCSDCHDGESRLVFARPVEQTGSAVPEHTAPPIAPATTIEPAAINPPSSSAATIEPAASRPTAIDPPSSSAATIEPPISPTAMVEHDHAPGILRRMLAKLRGGQDGVRSNAPARRLQKG